MFLGIRSAKLNYEKIYTIKRRYVYLNDNRLKYK